MVRDEGTSLSTDSVNTFTPISVVKPTGRERARSRWITVEPVIALAIMGYTCIALVRPLFVKDAIRQFYNYNETNETECVAVHQRNDTLDNKIQSEASVWLLYLGVASGIPGMLSTIIFSTMSDRLGRKMAMVLPILGFVVLAAVYCVTVQLKLPLAVLLAGEFIQGLTGGFGLLFAACVSYITDATSQKQRTMRIVIAEMLTFVVGGVNQVGQGYLIVYSFLPSLAIALGCFFVAVLYIAVPPLLVETVDTSGVVFNLEISKSVQRIKDVLAFNENGRRWQILLLDFFIFFMLAEILGYSSIFVLYGTAWPFCWTSVPAAIASALGLTSASLGMLFGTRVFSLCLGDYWLMQISCVSVFVVNLVSGLAKSTLVLFIGIILGSFRGIAIPVARSVLSKISQPDEIGAVFSLVGCLECLSSFSSAVIATSMYAATLAFMPPLTYYVLAGVTIFPVVTTLILQIYWPRREEYIQL